MITIPITIDVTQKYTIPIQLMQFDAEKVVFDVTLLNNSLPVDLTATIVRFVAEKPDHNLIANECTVTDAENGKCTYAVTTQTSAAGGKMKAQFCITYGSGGQKSTQEFIIDVLPSIDTTNAEESTSEFTDIQAALIAVAAYSGRIDQLEEDMATAQEDVISLDGRMTAAEIKAYGQAYRTSEFTVTNTATWYSVDLNAGHDNLVNVSHSTTVNPSRVAVQVDGDYEIIASASFKHTAPTAAAIRVLKNGSTEIRGSAVNGVNASSDAGQQVSSVCQCSLSAGDYITLQFSGSNAGGTSLTSAGYFGSGTVTRPTAMLIIKRIGSKTQ